MSLTANKLVTLVYIRYYKTLLFEKKNNTVPQVLNQGLDGSLYLATNPNWDMLRKARIGRSLEHENRVFSINLQENYLRKGTF